MLSIIIPTLNEEKYIPKLLNSLSIQDYKNFEVIIADGQSHDRTIEIARKNANDLGINIRCIQTNVRNTGKQRNIGAKAAIGEKLIFIDADIVIPNNQYLKRVNQSLEMNFSIVALVKVHPEEEKLSDTIFCDFLNGCIIILNDLGISGGRGAMIGVKKDEFHRVNGFNEIATIGEDVNLFLKLRKKPAIIKPPVYESARRYRKLGYWKVISSWIIDGLSLHIMNKPLRIKWEPIR